MIALGQVIVVLVRFGDNDYLSCFPAVGVGSQPERIVEDPSNVLPGHLPADFNGPPRNSRGPGRRGVVGVPKILAQLLKGEGVPSMCRTWRGVIVEGDRYFSGVSGEEAICQKVSHIRWGESQTIRHVSA